MEKLLISFATGKGDNNREIIFNAGGMADFTFLSKLKSSRDNLSSENESDSSASTYHNVVEQLNHMIWYFQNNRNLLGNGVDILDVFANMMVTVETLTKDANMDRICMERYTSQSCESLITCKQNYFVIDVVEKHVLFNENLIRGMYLYAFNRCDRQIEVKSNLAGISLPDIMCLLVTSLFMRILFILYPRVNNILFYKKLVKTFVPTLGSLVDKLNREYLPADTHHLMIDGFYDRLYKFVDHTVTGRLKYQEFMVNKFKPLGEHEMNIKIECLQSILQSMVRYCMFSDDTKKDEGAMLMLHPDKCYYPAKNLASYIGNTIVNTANNKTTLAKPRFISNVISSKSEEGEEARSSKAAKFEVMLEKQNKELYEEMVEFRDMIVEEEWSKLNLEQQNLASKILEGSLYERHTLGEFMVSKFLESEYGENIINYVNDRQYVIIAMRVTFRIMRFPNLACAVLSKVMGTQNNMVFDTTGMDTMPIFQANRERAVKIFTDIIRNNYVSQQDETFTTHRIENEFRQFIMEGVKF